MSEDIQGQLLPADKAASTESEQAASLGDKGADTPRFEALMQSLEEVVAQLEGGSLPLESALQAFEKGSRLAGSAQQILDAAQMRVTRLVKNDGGQLSEIPFEAPGPGRS